MSQPTPLAEVLPRHLAQQLQRASQVPNTFSQPRARIRAIDELTRRLKQDHPQFFRKDES